MDINLMITSFPKLLDATVVTVKLLSLSLFFGLFIGLLFAILRLSKNKIINKFAYGYSYVFRGTPLLVQIFIIYFGLGNIEYFRSTFLWVVFKEPYWCAIIAFALNTGAYTSEILRSAFQTIKPGFIEAGKSLGISNKIIFYKIQIPIAIRQSLPAYGNEIILMMKGTSLASTVTLMDFDLMINSLPKLLGATVVTLKLLSASLFFGLFIGLLFAVLRLNKNKIINKFAYTYSYVFRGTPLLVQIFIIYFGLGQIEYFRSTFLWVVFKEPYWCAIIAFALNTGAYTSEILRSAFQTIKPGLIEAGKSLGISNKIIFYKIQIPIAIRQSLPAYGNEIILMMKGTSLASTVTLMDLTGVAKYIISTTFKPIEVFIVAGGIYLFMTFIIHNVIKFLEKKYSFN